MTPFTIGRCAFGTLPGLPAAFSGKYLLILSHSLSFNSYRRTFSFPFLLSFALLYHFQGISASSWVFKHALIHDDEFAHRKLVKELNLESVVYASKDIKGLPDKKNPLNPVNRVHAVLKRFLFAHSGFNRDDIQGYLNLFAFVTNPPNDLLEKVELIVKLAFENPRLLRYRDFYGVKSDF
jgi:hypothetical protein